jgi:hypothetical protein
MANRTAKFARAIVAGLLAGAVITINASSFARTSAPVDGGPRSAVASHPPEQFKTNSPANPAPATSAIPRADTPPTSQVEASPPPVILAAAAEATQKTADWPQMQVLLILAALALASLTESAVWLARARRPARAVPHPRNIRQSAGPARRPSWAPQPPERPGVRADSVVRPSFTRADIRLGADDRLKRVEDSLARLSRLSQRDVMKGRRRDDVGLRVTRVR